MTDAERAEFDALKTEVRDLRREVKILSRDQKRLQGPVPVNVSLLHEDSGEQPVWEVEQMPDGKTRFKKIA